jgi:hypothetical protein
VPEPVRFRLRGSLDQGLQPVFRGGRVGDNPVASSVLSYSMTSQAACCFPVAPSVANTVLSLSRSPVESRRIASGQSSCS